MRSVSTIRPFGNTVRRRFLSVVKAIHSPLIVGQMGLDRNAVGGKAGLEQGADLVQTTAVGAAREAEMLYSEPSRD
jgi:hypothetical protein